VGRGVKRVRAVFEEAGRLYLKVSFPGRSRLTCLDLYISISLPSLTAPPCIFKSSWAVAPSVYARYLKKRDAYISKSLSRVFLGYPAYVSISILTGSPPPVFLGIRGPWRQACTRGI